MTSWKRLRAKALIFSGALAVLASDISPIQAEDRDSLEFVLGAMREAVFYAQHSIGEPVICATPIPIAGAELVEMVDGELENPTNPDGGVYTDATQVAFVLLTALKQHGACQ